MTDNFRRWTTQQLIARIEELEIQIKSQQVGIEKKPGADQVQSQATVELSTQTSPLSTPPKNHKAFDASRYSTRLIALKFAYLGQKYNGFEHHINNTTPLPTVEEELWKALMKTRLIDPKPSGATGKSFGRIDRGTSEEWEVTGADVNWEGCDYSKGGRTDRGVSAFGQVIGVRVRSLRPLPVTPLTTNEVAEERAAEGQQEQPCNAAVEQPEPAPPLFHDTKDELPYIQLLNRVLPPDIRIYAWCPKPPVDFSARFHCKERRYRYFFTNPSFVPPPGSSSLYPSLVDHTLIREGWLDISKMQQACTHLVGLHDFRNLCKLDPSKQIVNFRRRIFHAAIVEIQPLSIPSFLSHSALHNPPSASSSKMYALELHGSAFLWHQVRSIVAILFLIGQGLEDPSLIPALLDIAANPTRPKYEMAADAPLVLWDCVYPRVELVESADVREHGYEDGLSWVYVGDEKGGIEGSLGRGRKGEAKKGKWGRGGIVDDLWEVWRKNKMDETLSGMLLDRISAAGTATLEAEMKKEKEEVKGDVFSRAGVRLFDGGDFPRAKGRYMPVLKRERQEHVDVVNKRYAERKGIYVPRKKVEEDGYDE